MPTWKADPSGFAYVRAASVPEKYSGRNNRPRLPIRRPGVKAKQHTSTRGARFPGLLLSDTGQSSFPDNSEKTSENIGPVT